MNCIFRLLIYVDVSYENVRGFLTNVKSKSKMLDQII